ncbi:DUF2252 family protein [Cupriavidus sp. IK-TO18]|uniref:DUF2252 family protein n=1 Tax=Cupriavidus sp. IK-TO18 TaxID=2782182 RepID=UPI0018996D53|nr:DUF2252 family protein [Cupriavidus sp. IK-TO18]MBF6991531.1 DUF2252 family protein [Cupriavidus sp. IK-TO18]
MGAKLPTFVPPKTARRRTALLTSRRHRKMAASAHAYVRGSTARFYEWVNETAASNLPEGPSVWICGDCHTGNLGPVAAADGKVEIQIRDLDQTVIGNPIHDVLRLALSLATAARGSDLPGITILQMMEALAEGYESAFGPGAQRQDISEMPPSLKVTVRKALHRTSQQLARERIRDTTPEIPLGRRFWPLGSAERKALKALFEQSKLAALATCLKSRLNGCDVSVLDAAYWVKGCSSLGRLRYAVLLDVDGEMLDGDDLCLIDIKEGVSAAAPRVRNAEMPRDNAERVVAGAVHLSPFLGTRMCPARLLERSVVVRELLPQDLKLDMEQLARREAMEISRYLGAVVGKAHARQLGADDRRAWRKAMHSARSRSTNIPNWLWKSVIELLAIHQIAYLEHCRRHAKSCLRSWP